MREEHDLADRVLPKSVAVIMDGNGRWAQQRGMPRILGHREGAKAVRTIIGGAARLGLEALALYSFSQQNWSRPEEEINALMHLYTQYLIEERKTIMDHNVRLRHIGSRDGLPEMVLDALDETTRISAGNTGMDLCLALNYGGREEIVSAAQRVAKRVQEGCMKPEDITESVFAAALDTGGILDPDLLIRTSGEMRLSNFMLWQISYSEFYVTDVHWPDFGVEEFKTALRSYGGRKRRYGGLNDSDS
ncbi:MAG: isoprenyl transferase [Phycisphaerales bacterium]|nr:isoprenyl transferase [Phycisphaerales bacterium]